MIQVENQDGTWSEVKYLDKKAVYNDFWSVLRRDNEKVLK